MRKFLAVINMAINDAFIYRGDMLMWSISLIINPLVYLIIWVAISLSGGTPPLTQAEFIQYYLLIILVRIWSNAWHSQIIAFSIRKGEISTFLVKPISYLDYRLADSVGYKSIKAIFGFSACVLLAIAFNVNPPDATSTQWILFLVSTFMCGLMFTLFDASIGLLAFWLDDVTAIDELNDVLYMIFSGVIIPIAVFPQAIQDLLVFLPYKYLAAFPVEIVMGEVTGNDLILGLIVQFFWLITFFLLFKLLWHKGQVRYQAYGA